MPPHCDSKDGPVVKAAARALESARAELILPFVSEDAETEVRDAFEKTLRVRALGAAAAEVADEWFFETVVRLHRAGEGAPFTGLKPAGLGHGVVVPVAEQAIETGDVDEVVQLLTTALADEVRHKFGRVMRLQAADRSTVAQEREYVEAVLGFEVWAHKTHQCILSDPLHDHGSMAHKY